MRRMTADACGVSSDGLRIAQLPAAIAEMSGPRVRLMGKFHGERISTTPFGSYATYERVPRSARVGETRCGFIQRFRCRLACRASPRTAKISVRSTSADGWRE